MELQDNADFTPRKIEGFSGDPSNEMDLPPEYCHYRDEGCELADSCLNCPFAKCIYDEPGGKQSWLKRVRAIEMTKLFTIDGKGVKELSQMFGISRRTVQRALKTTLGNSSKKGQENE